ncbi:MAG: YitT family protein [Peptoniphilaceae bacterium]|uniref:YitT family protein n=1 Tax=Parvimonas sp. TaxID=1944660 RepID=UPI0025D2DA22|nr:YitT family protein [Parvimonas sp.]MCI5997211.1 YitT family protein [Parvimonas sp.]MDD7764488.1 YitT family protein [Peptoniphilaceae bacterium]MDY3051298.1 YitT family protein [Parvimonas sp.]
MLEEYFGDSKYIFKTVFFMLIGNIICSFAMVKLLIPAGLLSGGLGGIGLILEYSLGIPTGISVFVLNLPMMIVGFMFLKKKFMTYAFLSTFLLSFCLIVMRKVPVNINLSEPVLYAIFGGFLNGLGMGILFKHGSCQGGLDIIATICKSRLNINIGSTLMIINGFIIAFASYLFSIERGLFTIVAMYVAYKMLDKIQMGFGDTKQVMIVTSRQRDITEKILLDLNRGVTLLHGEGAFTHKQQNVIFCIVSTRQVAIIKKIVDQIDPKAFLIISEAYEVKGRGFRIQEI